MTSVAQQVIQAAAQAAPDSQILQAANDAVSTAINPSASNILADVEMAYSIISALKARMNATHESLWVALKSLIS